MRAILLACGVAALLSTTGVQAQTVRFQTSVGDFDMVLNPTNNPDLQPLVDNIIAYVGLGRYHYTAINRAADMDNDDPSDDFVLQMGGFLGIPRNPELFATTFTPVERFDPVIVDADGDGDVDFSNVQSNTRGTVSLALAAGNANSGTSSFFVNLGNNAGLDGQDFVPFAEVPDMTTVDTILSLMQRDLSNVAGQPGNLALIDVPLTADGKIVLVERVTVVDRDADFSFIGPIANALGFNLDGTRIESAGADDMTDPTSGLVDDINDLLNMGLSGGGGGSASLLATPEPTTASLLAMAVLSMLGRRRR